ncbi:MAG TPA: VOC family protein [Xanthobacteraceae bacterium]|jgi:catechol 2,3-dioxygenase-like lactoylglutathione lyase family enzyme
MARGLDHVVHAVRDLDAAADFYHRLGFTVGVRNHHPWGTQNHIIQFPGCFLELLAVIEPEKLGSDPIAALFGTFNRLFLKRQEGLSFVMLESGNAASDAAEFRASGIGVSDALRFEREGTNPDGRKVRLGFSVAFAREPRAPEIGFGVCQQHSSENFWAPALQKHANDAMGIAGAVLVTENPSDLHIFLSAFVGVRELQATSSGIVAPTPRGDIRVMDPAAFRLHFGVLPPDISVGARLAAVRFAVGNGADFLARARGENVPVSTHMGTFVIPPDAAHGATLVFEESERK